MIIKEGKKISKIVDELFLYFIKHGHSNVNFNVNIDEVNVVIDITLDNVDAKVIDKLNERISQDRELEIEEYGWELMGESDCSNELELIGLLVNSFTHTVVDNKDVLTFIRKRRR